MENPFDKRGDKKATDGEDVALHGLLREYARAGQGVDHAFVSRIMGAVEELEEHESSPQKSGKPIEPAWPWLGGRRFWRAAAVLACMLLAVLLGKTWFVATTHAGPAEVVVYGQPELTPGLPASFRVLVRDGQSAQGLEGVKVNAVLASAQGARVRLAQVRTDSDGFAVAEADLPDDLEEGDYTVQVIASTAQGSTEMSLPATVKRSFRTMLSTDKPLYQPGQTIHIRSLTLAAADLRPAQGREITLEVQDAKGNKVFKKVLPVSRFGIAAADFQLADQVNLGDYTVTATIQDTVSQRNVEVRRYALPKFKVDLTTDSGFYQPDAVVKADLQADYTFGKPVAGARVSVSAEHFVERFRQFALVQGRTDDNGHFAFEARLPEFLTGNLLNQGAATVRLVATVTDRANHEQVKSIPLTVSSEPIRVEVFPESGELVQHVENTLYIVTAYPDGRPAQTKLTLGADKAPIETSELGIAKVRITPQSPSLQLTISAEDRQGQRVRAVRPLRVGQRSDSFLLRTGRAVYRQGDTVNLEIVSAAQRSRVFVDVVKDRRTLLMKAIDVREGRGSLALDLAADMFGTLELQAYRILADGSIIRDSRVIQVNRANALQVTAQLDQGTYRPAEKALIELAVRRQDGDPAAAALSLAAVDEAVFALSDMRPGLEELYFALQQEILKPRYELHAPLPISPEQSLQGGPQPQLEEARVVLFSAAQASAVPEQHVSQPFQERQAVVEQQKDEFYQQLKRAAVLTPLALYLLTLLPFALYLCWRLVRRSALKNVEAAEMTQFKKWSQALAWYWLGAVFAPLGIAAIVYSLIDYRGTGDAGSAALLALGLTALSGLGAVIFALWRLSRCAVMCRIPVLSKVTRLLPWTYLLGLVAIGVPMASPPASLQGFDMPIILAAWLLAGLIFVVLSLARQTILRPVGRGRIAWLLVSRTAAVLLLAVSVISTSFSREAASYLMRAADQEEEGIGLIALQLKAAEESLIPAEDVLDLPLNGRNVFNLAKLSPPSPAAPNAASPARIRRHFPETLLWQPQLITDDAGKARLEVPLADSITTWRLAMSAVSERGELGSATQPIRVFQDFFVDIDFPVELTQNDEVSVPVAVFNYLPAAQTVRLEVQPAEWCHLLDGSVQELRIAADQVGSASIRLRALQPGRHSLTVKAIGSHLSDAVQRTVSVKPDGKPVVRSFSGRLDENVTQSVDFPLDAIEGGSDLFVKVYPGGFSQVVEGLDSILRMPFGCFEQTSSTTYPNVLVLDYLRQSRQIKPEVEMKALNYINLGYQRLLSFEVNEGGFEWFGNAPAHNVLTAYGLLEFADMSKVFEVDPSVIERTREWLYRQQLPDGRWRPSQGGIAEGAINRFQDQELRTTAYIAWALAESGQQDARLDRALNYLESKIAAQEDAYVLALAANALAAAGRDSAGQALAALDGLKTEEGDFFYWKSQAQGVTYSMGDSLAIETTAIAAYAMLKSNLYSGTAHKALGWLISKKDPNGTWHSTSATVHTMRALLAESGGGHAGLKGDKGINVAISLNGELADSLQITSENSDVYRLVSLREQMVEGVNQIAFEANGRANLAYQIVATHHLPWPQQGKAQPTEPLTIKVDYDTAKLQTDEILRASVRVAYNRPGRAAMVLVDLGIPPGFEVSPDSFQQLKDQGVIKKYSITGRQVVLYFDHISNGSPLALSFPLQAKYPLRVKTPASVAYLYYEPEVRSTSKPVLLEVEK